MVQFMLVKRKGVRGRSLGVKRGEKKIGIASLRTMIPDRSSWLTSFAKGSSKLCAMKF